MTRLLIESARLFLAATVASLLPYPQVESSLPLYTRILLLLPSLPSLEIKLGLGSGAGALPGSGVSSFVMDFLFLAVLYFVPLDEHGL